MAPPDTNLEKQKRRHKFPLVVMGVVVLLVGVMMLYWLAGLFNPEDEAGSEEGSAPIELPDAGQRQHALRQLVGLEHHINLQIEGYPAVTAIADEDLPRTTADKTSAVHFLRFEFTAEMVAAARSGASWTLSSQHPAYACQVAPLPTQLVDALCCDFVSGGNR